MARPHEPSEKLDNEEKEGHRDNQKVDHFPEEQPIRNLLAMNPRLPLLITLLARQHHTDQGHDNVLDERVDHLTERRPDDHTNGQIDDIAFERKILELLKE